MLTLYAMRGVGRGVVLQRDGSTDGGVAKVATVTTPSLSILDILCQTFPISRSRRTVDLDIYRTDNLLICEYGDQAAIEAAQRADAMRDWEVVRHFAPV
jgi:hypothetical protein